MSYTRLRYHLVWATKHRRKLITPEVERVIYPTIRTRAAELGCHVFEADGSDDHSHVAIGIPANREVSMVAGQLKSASAKGVNEAFPGLEFKWQKGFSAHTVYAPDFGVVCRYVRNQKTHHARETCVDELERLEDQGLNT